MPDIAPLDDRRFEALKITRVTGDNCPGHVDLEKVKENFESFGQYHDIFMEAFREARRP